MTFKIHHTVFVQKGSLNECLNNAVTPVKGLNHTTQKQSNISFLFPKAEKMIIQTILLLKGLGMKKEAPIL